MQRILKGVRNFFRVSWVLKTPGTQVPCEYCGGSGQYDPLYQTGVPIGDETVRTVDCTMCAGLGHHFFPKE